MTENLPEAPLETRKKRKYQYSSRERAKIAANRAAKRAKDNAENANKLADIAKKKQEEAKKKKEVADSFSKKISGESKTGYVVTGEEINASTPVARMIIDEEEVDIAFRANPGAQEEFLASSEKEVLYGGAAGGGKSFAMLADPLRYVYNSNHKALLVRKSMPELQELIDKSQELYRKAYPGAKWNQQKSRWIFPSGAIILMSFVENDSDVHRYQGQAFTWIGIDELTHYATPFVWNYLRSRLRTTDTSIETYMRATTNPGGVGGAWVKKMFISPASYNTAFWARDIDTDQILTFPISEYVDEKLRGKPIFKRRFIPAKLSDNPYLMRSPEYLAMLSSLPEVQRRRLLEGDWDVTEDTAFPEFDKNIHVIEPFDIPANWKRFRSCDYGYVAPSAVLWYTVSSEGTVYIYRELYEKGLDGEALAVRIIDMEWDDPGILTGPLDNESWAQRGQRGPSIAETMIKEGVRWNKADKGPGSRIRGKSEVHRRLKHDTYTEKPGVIIFSNCRNLIRTLPILPLDPNKPEDVDTNFIEDHLYDSLRYGLSSRPSVSLYPDEKRFIYQAEQPKYVDSNFGY